VYVVMGESKNLDFDDWYRADYRRVVAGIRIAAGIGEVSAEEAAQLACVKAFERWSKVSAMDSPVGWAIRVGVNGVRSGFTLRHSRKVIRERQGVGTPSTHTDDYSDHELWHRVQALPKKQRLAVVLRYVDDLSQHEIANRMEVAPGTVAATLHQARARLRASLSEES